MHVAYMQALVSCVALLLALLPAAEAQTRKAAAKETRTLCVHDAPNNGALNVHSGPANDSAVTGQFPAKACNVRLTGKCQGSWCEMTFGGTSGWVDTTFIGVFETQKAASTTTPSAKPATSALSTAATSPAVSPTAQPAVPSAKKHPAQRQQAERKQAEGRKAGAACVVHVESGDTLRIRRGPGVNHASVGGIPPGACGVASAGECRGPWCRINWRGQVGWVNTSYLRRDG